MTDSDERMFGIPGLIDYRLTQTGELYALTDGTVSEADIRERSNPRHVTVKKAEAGDRPLYIGKRRILPE